ncbi:protein PLASTID MOVEMENT IMPAIRED 2-like [Wolffia australiana]
MKIPPHQPTAETKTTTNRNPSMAAALKREMTKLKLETAMADRASQTAVLLSSSSLISIEALRKEIDDLNSDHVLVEIARLQAMAEAKDLAAKRTAEAARFSAKMNLLRAQIMAIKAEMMKIELERSKAEGFELMAAMDAARNELIRLRNETTRLRELEKSRDLEIQRLNSKLLKERSKLDAAIMAKKKSRSILGNLTAALKQLRSEAEAAVKEKEEVQAEARSTAEMIRSLESELESADQRLEDAIAGLKIAKNSESAALAKLKHLSERTMRFRACAAPRNAAITISAFEHDYLRGQAAEAQKIAEKKAEAAMAWIEAFKASENEIRLRIDGSKREMAEIGAVRRRSIEAGSLSLKQSRSRARRSSIGSGQRPLMQSPSIVLKRKTAMPALAKLLRRGANPPKEEDDGRDGSTG